MSHPPRLRVLVADDDRFMREALGELIGAEPDLELVAVAADAAEAVLLARTTRPDVALLDVKMPHGGGEAAARAIHADQPGIRIVALSAYEEGSSVDRMRVAGADAYVVKGAMGDEILSAIRSVSAGGDGVPAPPPVATALPEVIAERLVRVEFQPVVALAGGAVGSVEALARFPTQPARPPQEWFGAAGSADAEALELLTVRIALANMERLPPGVALSVNASPRVAASPAFADLLAAVDVGRVIVEIDRAATLDSADVAGLRILREHGVSLAADNFGVGVASLQRLVVLAPALIKVDGSLTRAAQHPGPLRAMLKGVIAFAAETGAAVVAKSVESRDQLEPLRACGVGHAQGYYIARPGPLPFDLARISTQLR